MGGYSDDFTPPAPTVLARITAPNAAANARQVEVVMLLDSGADVSLLPPAVAVALNLAGSGRALDVESFDNQRSTRPVVTATMHLEKYKMTIDFILHDEGTTTGIIGRNVLNLLRVVLDGPALTWTIGPTK